MFDHFQSFTLAELRSRLRQPNMKQLRSWVCRKISYSSERVSEFPSAAPGFDGYEFSVSARVKSLEKTEKRVSLSRHIDKDEYHKQTHNEPTKGIFLQIILYYTWAHEENFPEFKCIRYCTRPRQPGRIEDAARAKERSVRRERAEETLVRWSENRLRALSISWGIKIKSLTADASKYIVCM